MIKVKKNVLIFNNQGNSKQNATSKKNFAKTTFQINNILLI